MAGEAEAEGGGVMAEPQQKLVRDYLALVRANLGRFWSKVDITPACWDWIAGKDKDGYGFFVVTFGRVAGRQRMAKLRSHRVAYELEHGPIPDGLLVLHSCDNPACCNPSHLRAGTQKENRGDSVARGRVARGERHGTAKLSEAQAREVIRLRKSGEDVNAIAARFGIAAVTVYQVGRNHWKHLA